MSDNQEVQQTHESESKHRRLVPQFSLNARQDVRPSQHEAVKKTVIRFTREQLIALRKPAVALASMKLMTEIVSVESQEPVCFNKLEPEDVIRIWNAATKELGGRGRGRARTNSRTDDGGHDEDHQTHSNLDLWDDGSLLNTAEGKDFDLSEISKASLQFRTDMENMKLSDEVDIAEKEIDTMESLLEQQTNLERAARSEQKEVAENISASVKTQTPLLSTLVTQSTVPLTATIVEQENKFPTLSVPNFSAAARQLQPIELDLHLEKPSILPETNNFLKNVIGENVSGFLSSIPVANNSLLTSSSFPVNSIFQQEPVLYPTVEPEWFYTDPQQQVQGPFSQENMRLWNEAGYFAKELPVKLRHWSNFHLFKDVFPDSRLAFYTTPVEPLRPNFGTPSGNISFLLPLDRNNNSIIHEGGRRIGSVGDKPSLVLGNDQLLRSMISSHDQFPAKPSTEISKFDSISIHKASPMDNESHFFNENNRKGENSVLREATNLAPVSNGLGSNSSPLDKSDYAKRILGISKKTKDFNQEASVHSINDGVSGTVSSVSHQKESGIEEEQDAKEKKSILEAKQKQGWRTADAIGGKPVSFLDIQHEAAEAEKTKDKPTAQTQPVSSSTPTAMSVQLKSLLGLKSAGTSTVSSPASNMKSKSAWSSSSVEVASIPLTEIMKEEINQQLQKKDDVQEKPRGTTWASKIASKSDSTVQTQGNFPSAQMPSTSGAAKSNLHTQPGVHSASSERAAVLSNSRNTSKGVERSDFGGKKMSKELADWCTVQLKAIKGIEDLTLMEFCMSLSSAAEVRETLSSYLGSSPQVTNFATEFIKYKDEGKLPSAKVIGVDVSVSSQNNLPKKKRSAK